MVEGGLYTNETIEKERLKKVNTVEECINLVKSEKTNATGMQYGDWDNQKNCVALYNITSVTKIETGYGFYLCSFKGIKVSPHIFRLKNAPLKLIIFFGASTHGIVTHSGFRKCI